MNHEGSQSPDPEHENLQTLTASTGDGHGSTPGKASLVMATRFVTPVRTPCRTYMVASDLRSEPIT
ncbi:hypothetical protein SAMN02745898_105290 [Streptomyces sp. 136MFCol5.1]|nr:hypothetical protein SAMN02745898_105290 [Streptomyces sp. 136MFCol5.1]SFS98576.1 hypothetical protein SAMN04487982_105289 [Streptomyces sp. ok210]